MWWIILAALLGMVIGYISASILRMSSEQERLASQSYAWIAETDRLRAEKNKLEQELAALRREVDKFISEDLAEDEDLDR